jgi:hypothetical protein
MEATHEPARLTPQRRRGAWRRPRGLALMACAGLVAVAFVPTETKQGVNFAVSSHRLPLYAKTLDFLQRDSSYARLASRIAAGHAQPEARTLAVFAWTRDNIRDTPGGFPVVDDHVWNIVIRGYGEADQKADVFTTLSMYAGVPAFFSNRAGESGTAVLSYAWIDRQWRVFDVDNGVIFRTRQGTLASAEEAGFAPPVAPDVLRPELQMLWPRVWSSVGRLIGVRREWQRQP